MARVGIDLDGVVVDFVDSYRTHVRKTHAPHSGASLAMPEPTHWDFYKDPAWGSQKIDQFQLCLEGFDQIFSEAKPYPGAEQALVRLLDAGHTLVFITDRSINPRAYEITREWIHREMPDVWEFRDGIEIHITADKASIDVDYFIDDKPENVRAMLDKGVQAYLCTRLWNATAFDLDKYAASLNTFVTRVLSSEGLKRLAEMPSVFENAAWADSEEVRVTSATGGQKGQKQARLGSLDPKALLEVAKVAGFGEQKYARLNYMNGYDWSLTFDAGMRHRLAFWSGEDLDPESGLPHLAHAAWHDLCLLAFYLHGLGADDRYRKPEEDVA